MGKLVIDLGAPRSIILKNLPFDTFAVTKNGNLVWRDSLQGADSKFQSITNQGTCDTYECDSQADVTILPTGTKITLTI